METLSWEARLAVVGFKMEDSMLFLPDIILIYLIFNKLWFSINVRAMQNSFSLEEYRIGTT